MSNRLIAAVAQRGRAASTSSLAVRTTIRSASNASKPPSQTSVSTALPASSSTNSSSSNRFATRAAVDRTKSKLPTAKAKAQASKALRQQLQAASLNSKSNELGKTGFVATTASQEGTLTSQLDERYAAAAEEASRSSSVEGSVGYDHSELKEVVAWATADSYNFDALIQSGRLPAGWTLLENDEALHIPSWPPHSHLTLGSTPLNAGTGEVFIFQSGAYVTWGLSEDQSHRFLRSVIRGRPAMGDGIKGKQKQQDDGVEREQYQHIGDEGMEWVWHEEEPTRIVGDVIVLGRAPRRLGQSAESNEETATSASANNTSPEDSSSSAAEDWSPLLARLAYSQGLSRSARLSAQEEALDTFLSPLNSIPERLEAAGKVPLPRKEVIRKMGTLLRLRQRANLGKDNFLDDPEGHWENGSLEYHYDEICRSLDIEPRFRALNEKLDHCENLLGVLRALLTERSSHRMELIIIYLIAFEATLAVISHDYVPTPKRIWRLFTGQPWSEHEDSFVNASSPPVGEQAEIGLTLGLLKRALPLLDGEETTVPSQASSRAIQGNVRLV